MKPPTSESFKEIARDFFQKWDFPNCIGALDGKHIRIKCPAHSGTMFYNYKQYFSIVLQGVTDANYKFIAIDVGAYGKQSDGGTFRHSALGKLMQENKLDIPHDEYLPNTDSKLPYVFIADEAYPLTKHLLKPYSRKTLDEEKEIFNKRLSRARKTVECSFGILFSMWRIIGKAIETKPETADLIVKAICILHNTLIDCEGQIDQVADFPHNKNGVASCRAHNHSSLQATNIRDTFKTYFCNHPKLSKQI